MKILSDWQILFFKNDNVLRLEAIPGKTVIHFVEKKQTTIDESFENIEAQLQDQGFIRIHNRHIVNVNCIEKIAGGNADFVELSNAEVLPIKGKQKELIIELITGHLEKNIEKRTKKTNTVGYRENNGNNK